MIDGKMIISLTGDYRRGDTYRIHDDISAVPRAEKILRELLNDVDIVLRATIRVRSTFKL